MDTKVVHDQEKQQFILYVADTEAGVIAYREKEGARNFYYTGVHPEFQGKGLSKVLIRAALDTTLEEGAALTHPGCSAVVGYISAHPEYAQHIVAG